MNDTNLRTSWHGLGQLAIALLLLLPLISPAAWGQSLADVPGVVIDYRTNASRYYFFSDPEITVLPNGDYVAAHALAGALSGSSISGTTSLFRSSDKGATWSSLGTLTDMVRGSLFQSGDSLYLIGANKDSSGTTRIRKSLDNGTTWTTPVDANTGKFTTIGPGTPTNPVAYNGRIWCGWSTAVFSAAEGADLLESASWTLSNAPTWDNYFGSPDTLWFEGQVMASPTTGVVVMPKIRPDANLQYYTAKPPYTAVIEATSASTTTFDSTTGFVPLPGGEKKFGASYDAVSGKFYILSNPVLPAHANDPNLGNTPEMIRNTAAMLSSKDLYHWDVEKLFLYTPDLDHEGFQYFNFDYDGDDMVMAARTAFDIGGALDRGHDSNLLTFHKIENFRTAAPDQYLIVDTTNNQVLRYETTQYQNAPLGKFTLGSTFDGAAINRPVSLAQDGNGDVFIREENGRILQFDALGNFVSTVSSSPVAFQGPQLAIAQPAYGDRGWTKSGSGDWSDITNWYYWGRPDTDHEVATFGSAIDSDSTVTLNETFTMKGLRFRSANRYTLAGTGSIVLQSENGNGIIDVLQGDHESQLAITLNSNIDANLQTAASLAFHNKLDLNGQTLVIAGPGEMFVDGEFVMHGGTLTLDGLSPLHFASTSLSTLDGQLQLAADDAFDLTLGLSLDLLDGTEFFGNQRFNQVILPILRTGLTWDTSRLYVDGIVTVMPEPGSLCLLLIAGLLLQVFWKRLS